MLQARGFAYPDAHRYRVGTHHEMLPINRPLVEVNTYHKDGSMNFEDINKKADITYEPNSFNGAKEDSSFAEPSLKVDGEIDRYDRSIGNDYFYQARDLFNLMNENQKEQLYSNIAGAMDGVPQNIIDKQLTLFEKVAPEYASGVKKALS